MLSMRAERATELRAAVTALPEPYREVVALDAPRDMPAATLRTRQIPLAVVMVALTTLTLWSLGHSIVVTPEEVPAAQIDIGQAQP